MTYDSIFSAHLHSLKMEGRYRIFADLQRLVGQAPYALWHSPEGEKKVIVWWPKIHLQCLSKKKPKFNAHYQVDRMFKIEFLATLKANHKEQEWNRLGNISVDRKKIFTKYFGI